MLLPPSAFRKSAPKTLFKKKRAKNMEVFEKIRQKRFFKKSVPKHGGV